MLGHDWVDDAAVDATCTEGGREAGRHCSRCPVTEGGAATSSLGHDYGAWTDFSDTEHQHTCTRVGCTEAQEGHTQTAPHTYGTKAVKWTDDWHTDPADSAKEIRNGTQECDDCTHTQPVVERRDRGQVTLTITYVVEGGAVAAPNGHSENLYKGDAYSVDSPSVTGYTPDVAVVSGTAGEGDINVTVTYKVNTHNLRTVVRVDGTVESDTGDVATAYGTAISAPADREGFAMEVTGYQATMPDADLTIYVDYTTIPAGSHALRIVVRVDGATQSDNTTVTTVGAGISYPSERFGYSMSVTGYQATMPDADLTIYVDYTSTAVPTTPAPSPTPSNEVVVDDPDVPLTDAPELPEEPQESETVIDDPEVPLNSEPETVIDDPEVPLNSEPETVIDDPEVPQSDVPQTGDISPLWYCAAALSAGGLTVVRTGKKRKSEDD